MLKDQVQAFLDGTGPIPPIIQMAMDGQAMLARLFFIGLIPYIVGYIKVGLLLNKKIDDESNPTPQIFWVLFGLLGIVFLVTTIFFVVNGLHAAVDPGDFAVTWYKSHKF